MKERIDILLVERRLVESRTKAQWLIKSGYVYVEGKKITKPGKKVENSYIIHLNKTFPYVGRRGLKLEAALKEFSIVVEGKTCVDVGSSIGGFTDCLLKHGAKKVYSIDIGTNLLHPSLRCEKNKEVVIPLLGIDARDSIPIDEKADIIAIDITFSSLKAILPNVKEKLNLGGDIIALIKPIFETEFINNQNLSVIQDPKQLTQILTDLIQWCITNQFFPYKIFKSPILGKEGAIEFFIQLKMIKYKMDFKKLISKAVGG